MEGFLKEKFFKLEEECIFPDISTDLLLSKFITTITGRKLREKLLKEKELVVPKVVEQIQQNTYDRKHKNNIIPEALTSNRGNKIKEQPICKNTYTTKSCTRLEKRPKKRNCRFCYAPTWNPNHKCPARECQKCKRSLRESL